MWERIKKVLSVSNFIVLKIVGGFTTGVAAIQGHEWYENRKQVQEVKLAMEKRMAEGNLDLEEKKRYCKDEGLPEDCDDSIYIRHKVDTMYAAVDRKARFKKIIADSEKQKELLRLSSSKDVDSKTPELQELDSKSAVLKNNNTKNN